MAGKTAILSVKIVSDAKRFQKGMAHAQEQVSKFNSVVGNAAKIASLTTSLGALGSVALASVSNLSALAGGIASIGGAALALPGVFAGAAVAMTVLGLALKDSATVLGDLAPKFGELQAAISAKFWSTAEGAVRGFVGAFLPLANEYLPQIAEEMGRFAVAITNVFTNGPGMNVLRDLFINTREAVDIAGEGVGYLTEAIVRLVGAGVQYLPALASGFNGLMEKFAGWATQVTTDGSMQTWVTNGVAALGQLASVVGSVVSILVSIGTAAASASTGGLLPLAQGLQRVADVVAAPAFQTGLRDVFLGAQHGVDGLLVALGPLSAMFVQLAPTLTTFLSLAGQIAGVALTALAPAIGAVVAGLTPLAQQLGGVVLTLLQQLATWVQQNSVHIQAFATAISQFLGSALTVVAPLLSSILNTFLQMVGIVLQNKTAFIGLGVGIMAGVAAFNAMKVAATVISTVKTLILGLETAMAAYRAGMTIATAVQAGFNLALVANPIGIVVVAVAALVAALVYFVTQTETGRRMWQQFTSFLGTAIGGAINGVKAAVSGFGSWFGGIVNGLKSAWSVAWSAISALTRPIIAGIQQALSGFFAIGNALLGAFKAAWSLAFAVIKLAIVATFTAGQVILNTFMSVARTVTTFVRNAFQTAFNAVKAVINAVLTWAMSKVDQFYQKNKTTIDGIRNAFTTGFNAVKRIVDVVIRAIMSYVDNLKRGFGVAADFLKSQLGGAFNTLKGIADGVIGSIVRGIDGITNGLRGAVDWVRKLTSGFQPPAWLTQALGMGGTGFEMMPVMPSFGAGQAMGGTGSLIGPAIFDRSGTGVRRNERRDTPNITVNQTINPSPGMNERDLANKTSRELMNRIV